MRRLFALPILLFFLLALAPSSLAQLTSQGNEQVVSYSGSTAFILTNTPVNPNLLTNTGTNTFILNINPPSNSLRVYITNDTANACNNLTLTVASTGNSTLNSFNSSVNAWQSVQVQSGNGGLVSTQPITLPASGTVAVTSVPVVASKVAIFLVLSSACPTTTIDMQVSFGTFSPSTSAVQGTVPPGANASAVNPVITGGIDNSGFAEQFRACSISSATGCSGGGAGAFSLAIGANGNSVASVGTTGVTVANPSSGPLATVNYGVKSTSSTGVMAAGAVSGGTQSTNPGDNPSGIFVSDTGYFHLTASQVISSSQALPLFGLGSTIGNPQQGSAVFGSCYVQVTAQNTAGTTPTLDVFLQTSTDGTVWNDRIHLAQFTTGTTSQYAGIAASAGITPAAVSTGALAAATKVDGPIGVYGRFSFVLGGTASPSYTVTSGIACK